MAVIGIAHPVLGMAAALASLMMLGRAIFNDRTTRRGIESLQQEATRATRYLESSMPNAEVAQTLGMGSALISRSRHLNKRVAELQHPTARKSIAMSAVTKAARQMVQIFLQALGAYLVITGKARLASWSQRPSC